MNYNWARGPSIMQATKLQAKGVDLSSERYHSSDQFWSCAQFSIYIHWYFKQSFANIDSFVQFWFVWIQRWLSVSQPREGFNSRFKCIFIFWCLVIWHVMYCTMNISRKEGTCEKMTTLTFRYHLLCKPVREWQKKGLPLKPSWHPF